MNIDENIRRIRSAKGITQKDFAEQLDIPYQTYNNYERGFRTPSPEMLLRIANGLEVSIGKIFEDVIYESKNNKEVV